MLKMQIGMQRAHSEHKEYGRCMTDGEQFVAPNRLDDSVFHYQGVEGMRSFAEYQPTLTGLTAKWWIVKDKHVS